MRDVAAHEERLHEKRLAELEKLLEVQADESRPHEFLSLGWDGDTHRGFGIYTIDGVLLRTVASAVHASEIIHREARRR
jgi:hypothetical protein